jgi:hypothetical protein
MIDFGSAIEVPTARQAAADNLYNVSRVSVTLEKPGHLKPLSVFRKRTKIYLLTYDAQHSKYSA